MSTTSPKGLLPLVVVIVLALVTLAILKAPDQRTTGQRVGDAIDALPQGPDKAARQLERRTPGERLGDAVKDAGEDIKRDSAPNHP